MSIWRQLYGSLSGGWKTHGPASISGPGAFDSSGDSPYSTVTAETALRLSAVWSCMNLRSEVIGTLPLNLRDRDKKVLTDHPLYNVLHRSPNANMTAPEFFSLATAYVDMKGNSVNIIERGVAKKVVALTPCDPDACTFELNKSGSRKTWKIGKDEFSDDDILHLRGFTMDGGWGAPRLDIGRQILSAQLTANHSAMMAFKQGLKVGGFFINERAADLSQDQLKDFAERLNQFGRAENAGKWMALLKGLKPIAGTEFAVKPSDAQLLESRYFGIEEICRLFNVPPQLIGHTNKASSWASSLENINLHFVTYSVNPTVIRMEKRIEKKLLTPYDIAQGIEAKFSLQGLLRGDTKTRQAFYASGLQNGWLNRDEVRDLEDRGKIPGGDKYTVQLNMTDVSKLKDTDGTGKAGDDSEEGEDE